MNDIIITGKMPILALRGMTVFPDQTVHFDIGRIKSALALDSAMKKDQILMQYQYFVGDASYAVAKENAAEMPLRSGENFIL